MIAIITSHPELSGYMSDAFAMHDDLRARGYTSYQLGPFTTNDVVDALRAELEEAKNDYLCLAAELDGHDATECLMNLRQLKTDIQTLIAWVDDGGDQDSQALAAAMWAKYPKRT